MKLTIPVHPIAQFTHHAGTASLVAEASDLGATVRAGRESFMGRVYDDACDVGFEVQGRHRTVLFTLSRIDKDAEGDIRAWVFAPALVQDRQIIGIRQVTVFND